MNEEIHVNKGKCKNSLMKVHNDRGKKSEVFAANENKRLGPYLA